MVINVPRQTPVLRSTRKRGRKPVEENALNIDSVVPAAPIQMNIQPAPQVEVPEFPQIISQDPSRADKPDLEGQTQTLTAPITPSAPVSTTEAQVDIAGADTPEKLTGELQKQQEDVESKITALNKKISESPQRTLDARQKLGIDKDQADLNALNAQLSGIKADLLEAQDREVELRERGRQKISDFAGTARDLGQLTNQELRENRLDQLALSRTFSRLGDTAADIQASINANTKIINDRAAAELAQDQFEISQNNAILDRVIQTQGNLLTAQQKRALEDRKFEQQILLQDRKAEIENKKTLLTTLLEKGNVSPATLSELGGLTFPQIVAKIAQDSPASESSWIDYDERDALTKLNSEQYERWQAYNGLDENSRKEKMKQEALVESTGQTISLIDSILNNSSGLEDSVGTTQIGSRNILPFNQGDVNKFRSEVVALSSLMTLDTLKNLKASGATLGAISEKELRVLQTANTQLGLALDKDGNPTGRSRLSESDFKNRLADIQSAAYKVNILNDIGREEFDRFNIKDKSNEALQIFYNDVKSGNIPLQQETEPNLTGGVDLDKIVAIESGGSYTAENPTSGAFGKYQFIPSTMNFYADKLGMTDEEARTPQGQERMFEAFTMDNVRGLEQSGIPVNTVTTYLAHQQGLGGARQIVAGDISPGVRRNILSNIPADYADKPDEEVIQGWFDTYLPRLV